MQRVVGSSYLTTTSRLHINGVWSSGFSFLRVVFLVSVGVFLIVDSLFVWRLFLFVLDGNLDIENGLRKFTPLGWSAKHRCSPVFV
jgi:hypothetical protein